MIVTLLILVFWIFAGTDPVARINADHSMISLTGWGTAFLICILIDAAVAAYRDR